MALCSPSHVAYGETHKRKRNTLKNINKMYVRGISATNFPRNNLPRKLIFQIKFSRNDSTLGKIFVLIRNISYTIYF